MDQFERAKLEDALLMELIKHSPHLPLDTAMAYQRLSSFDLVLEAISQATKEGRPLTEVVEAMAKDIKKLMREE